MAEKHVWRFLIQPIYFCACIFYGKDLYNNTNLLIPWNIFKTNFRYFTLFLGNISSHNVIMVFLCENKKKSQIYCSETFEYCVCILSIFLPQDKQMEDIRNTELITKIAGKSLTVCKPPSVKKNIGWMSLLNKSTSTDAWLLEIDRPGIAVNRNVCLLKVLDLNEQL